jgi:DNA primase
MSLFSQAFIEDVRLQANIVQVIQEHVSLKRVGRTYKGLCPFHSEKTPSFHVDAEKGFFHCFGCSMGGDVFKFIELHEKVGFADAVRMLAQKVGMALPDPVDGDMRQDTAVREALLKIHEVAATFFREQLASPPGGRARQQLRERGILPQTIDQLGLGYAPSSRDLLKTRLSSQGFSHGLLVQSGLVVEREDRSVVDRFRNRLMVPICREAGSVIAFGGRAMDPDQVPKYLNSPETPIYSKSRTLYGLNLSKSAIRQLGYAVIVEGYFDFAQVFQSQAAPVVASCGTALTPAQAQLLRRFSSHVVLSFDPDAAGQGAAVRSCELLVAEGFEVNVLVLDRGEDPDTFIRRQGAEHYRERLRSSRPYLEFLLDRAASGVDFANDERRRQFLHQMLAVAARIPDAAGRDQFADRIAHKARVTEEVVRAEIRRTAVQRRTEVTSRQLPASGELKQAEKGLIWALVHDSRAGLDALTALEPDDLSHLAGREIFDLARSLRGSTPPDGLPTALLQRLSTQNAQVVTAVAAADSPPVLSPVECARALRRLRWQRERADVQREIDRLQGEGSRAPSGEIDLLLRKKHDLGLRIDELN